MLQVLPNTKGQILLQISWIDYFNVTKTISEYRQRGNIQLIFEHNILLITKPTESVMKKRMYTPIQFININVKIFFKSNSTMY